MVIAGALEDLLFSSETISGMISVQYSFTESGDGGTKGVLPWSLRRLHFRPLLSDPADRNLDLLREYHSEDVGEAKAYLGKEEEHEENHVQG